MVTELVRMAAFCRRSRKNGKIRDIPEAPKELPPEQPPLSERGFDAADHPLSGVPNVEARFHYCCMVLA